MALGGVAGGQVYPIQSRAGCEYQNDARGSISVSEEAYVAPSMKKNLDECAENIADLLGILKEVEIEVEQPASSLKKVDIDLKATKEAMPKKLKKRILLNQYALCKKLLALAVYLRAPQDKVIDILRDMIRVVNEYETTFGGQKFGKYRTTLDGYIFSLERCKKNSQSLVIDFAGEPKILKFAKVKCIKNDLFKSHEKNHSFEDYLKENISVFSEDAEVTQDFKSAVIAILEEGCNIPKKIMLYRHAVWQLSQLGKIQAFCPHGLPQKVREALWNSAGMASLLKDAADAYQIYMDRKEQYTRKTAEPERELEAYKNSVHELVNLRAKIEEPNIFSFLREVNNSGVKAVFDSEQYLEQARNLLLNKKSFEGTTGALLHVKNKKRSFFKMGLRIAFSKLKSFFHFPQRIHLDAFTFKFIDMFTNNKLAKRVLGAPQANKARSKKAIMDRQQSAPAVKKPNRGLFSVLKKTINKTFSLIFGFFKVIWRVVT